MAQKTSQQLFEEMKQLFQTFEEEHQKTTKVSKKEARKAIGTLKGLITEYRKVSVEENRPTKE